MPKFISSNTLNIVCEDCIGSGVLESTENDMIFNGETYSMADVEFFYDADTNEIVPYEDRMRLYSLSVNGGKMEKRYCKCL